MNFGLLMTYMPLLLSGLVTTINLALLSFALAIFMGGMGAIAQFSRFRIFRYLANFYTATLRGIPDLVMIFLVYYGGQNLLNHFTESTGRDYINVSTFWAGVLTLGFYNGAFLVAVFRGAYLGIPKGQIEAAKTLGLNKLRILKRIMLPQLLVLSIAGMNNVWQVLMKSTALVSVIGLYDLVGYADKAAKSTKQHFLFFLLVVVFYLCMTLFSSGLFYLTEKRTMLWRRRTQS